MNDSTTDDIQSVQGTTPDFKTEFAKQLSELAPELVTDGKIDGKKLQELLDGDEADDSERFGLFWPGKKRAMRAAQEPTTATLKPVKEESKDWDTTQNLFIEGDNLEVLKVLQKHYHNKIKMIYIDPPYNTGKDFVYPDNYKEGLASYLEFTNQVDNEGRKVSTNSDTDGRYHSNWLNMMYPRLKLARNLLTDDGIIAISIDDHESDNLKKIAVEIFGEDNYIGTIIWNHSKQTKNDEPFLASNHNYVHIFRRSSDRKILRVPRTEENDRNYSNPDNDPRGKWRTGDVRSPSLRKTLRYPITTPSGGTIQPPDNGWRWTESEVKRKIQAGEIIFSSDETRIIRKIYLADQIGRISESIWPGEVYGTTRSANAALKELFDGKAYFDTPKPVQLIGGLMKLFSSDEDFNNFTVMDFFSGSGTTGHAVLSLNAEDGGSRSHIQVQLPEPLEEKSEAYMAGFRSIADIAKERLRKAGNKLSSSNQGRTLDTGFRVYRLADSYFTKWQAESDVGKDKLQQHLLDIRDSSNDAASEEELLTEVLIKQGISLTAPISHDEVDGLSVWTVGDNLVCAYLNEKQKPSLDQLRAVAAKEPAKLIILEDAFQGDDELKTNLHQICKSQKIELWTV